MLETHGRIMMGSLARTVVISSLVRYLAEAVLVGGGAIAIVVVGMVNHRVAEAAVLGAMFAVLAALAARNAKALWPIDGCRTVRELTAPSGGRDAIAWAYLVRRGGPIGPWAGCIQLRFVDGSKLRLHTSRANAEELLDAIATLPDVLVGYTDEAARAYKQRVKAT